MTNEESREYLYYLSYQLGSMAMEYLSDKDGEKMREAIQALELQPCKDCDYRNLKIKLENAEDIIRGLQEDLRYAREELRWR